MKKWIALVAVVIGGCSSSEPPSPSSFIKTTDLDSVVRTAASAGIDVSPEAIGDYTGDREKAKGASAKAEVVVSFRCEAAKVGVFATDVAEALHKEILSNRLVTDSTVPQQHDWSKPLTLDYTESSKKGVIRIAIGKTTSTDYPHELKVTIEESVAD